MNYIPHNKPTLGIEEEVAAQRVIRSGWLAQGKEVENLENAFCDFMNIPHGHALAVSSGTAALYLALSSLNSKGNLVAFPSYVCSSLRYAVSMAQANEIVIDTEENTPNISISELNKSKSDIVIIPHMYGTPVDTDKINPKLTIIEDCCQAIGATYMKKKVGLNGKVGVFSFYATKLMTSGGQGGMIVSKDKSLIEEIKDYREFDMRSDKKMRFNFQMTDLQAAIGFEQLKKLPELLKRREIIYNNYLDAGLDLQLKCSNDNSKPIRYRAILHTDRPNELIKKLADKNIKAIIPIEDWELLSPTPNATKYSRQNISLPLYPGLTDDQIKYIINTFQ